MAVWNVIDHTELSGATASWDVTSISSSYDHLYGVVSARSDDTGDHDQCLLILNNDSGSNYPYMFVGATTDSVSSGYSLIATSFAWPHVPATDAVADYFGTFTFWIPDYSNTTHYKNLIGLSTVPNNSTANYEWLLYSGTGAWADTSAVDQITLSCGNNFVQYSTFTLYGINGV